MGRAWHEACFRCEQSGEALGEGDFYLHEGAPLSGAALRHTAPLCVSCGEPALKARLYRRLPHAPTAHADHTHHDYTSPWLHLTMVALAMATLTMPTIPMKARLFAMGNAYHRACFRCACCQSEIGDRRFVPHDGELWRHEPMDP